MNQKTRFSSLTAAAALLTTALPTGALGACKATLRGELVQAPGRHEALPRKFLVFDLFEPTRGNGTSSEKRLKSFQSFVIPNTSTTFPIPFALDINSPRDCPGELELRVGTSNIGGVRSDGMDRVQELSFGDVPLTGEKTIRIGTFESVPVWAHWRRF